MLELLSTQSMQTSLISIYDGNGGLNVRRQKMLDRAPQPGDWAVFTLEHLEMKDLAYLTAKTGHEFAILRGKSSDILFHGDCARCSFDDQLTDMLLNHQFTIFGHSHPGEDIPVPSAQDRDTLIMLGQDSSRIISGRTGRESIFHANMFDDLL